MMKFKVKGAISISRTGAFYPIHSEVILDEHLNKKEADFLLKAGVIEEIDPEVPQEKPKPKSKKKG